MSDGSVGAAIRKLRNKIWLGKIVESFVIALLVSSIGILLLSVLGHFIVIVDAFRKALFLLAAACTAGLVVGIVRRPGVKYAAREGDRRGLQDRLTTYLEYGDRNGAVIEAFREELDGMLAGCNPAALYQVNFHGRRVLAAAFMLGLAVCVSFLPSPCLEEARAKEEVNRELRQEAENIAQLKKSLEEEAAEKGDVSAEEHAAELLARLERELAQSYSYQEAALQVVDTLQEIEKLGDGLANEDIKGLAGIFEGAGEKYTGAANLLRSGDAEGAARALKDLDFTKDEKKAMLANTNRLLESSGSEAQKQALQKAKTALAKEGSDGQELADAMKSTSNKKVEEGLQQTEMRLESMKERLLAKSDGGMKTPGGENRGIQYAEGEREELGSGEITNREATSVAQGESGNRATENPDALGGGVPGSGGREKSGREGQVGKSENPVFAGNDAAGEILDVRGRRQDNEGQMTERVSDRVIGLEGEKGDCQALYTQFQQEGMKYVDRFEIPPGKRQLVLGYFRELKGDN